MWLYPESIHSFGSHAQRFTACSLATSGSIFWPSGDFILDSDEGTLHGIKTVTASPLPSWAYKEDYGCENELQDGLNDLRYTESRVKLLGTTGRGRRMKAELPLPEPSVGIAAARAFEVEPEKEHLWCIARNWYAAGLADVPGTGSCVTLVATLRERSLGLCTIS